ncbi:MAG: alanine racemase [Bacteroidales bacterium]|nr:alanine racemase [Bacteroidales bacterium]
MLTIKKPTLLLNTDICRSNIQAMAKKAREHKVIFRPHFKTHQSAEIGEWFREEGVTAITVSSVSMAQYFANHGWKDITIAFPVNLLEIDEINQLASYINVHLLIESEETARFLKERLTAECGFFIKIDTGYHRTGIAPSNVSLINKVLQAAESPNLQFEGFLTHSGNAYHANDREELIRIQQTATENLLRLKKHFHLHPHSIISVGDTPSCCQLPVAPGIDEIRPGNFVFFDVMQFALGSCKLEDIAVALVCPVVAIHPNRQEAIIYGGAVHLSKEQTLLPADPDPIYGLAVNWNGKSWDTFTLLGKVRSLSQEHGILSLTQAGCNLKPGELVAVLPVHSCLTANLMRKYMTLDGDKIESMNS